MNIELTKLTVTRKPLLVFLSFLVLNLLTVEVRSENNTGDLIAKIDNDAISLQEYSEAWGRAIKQRYYHGSIPEKDAYNLRRELAEDLVNRHILAREATRLGLKVDDKKISDEIANYENKYAASPEWQANRTVVIPKLRKQLTEDDLISQLKEDISNIAIPGEVKVRQYYAAHPEKFTIPQQVDVSVILLKVDPWASQSTWQSKREQIVEMIEAVENGSDFAELAKKYSEDKSANQGGKLGRVHLGRLVEDAQVAVDALDIGELTQPLPLLEGVTVFKLNERFQPQLKPFADVGDRASRLLLRELRVEAWHTYVESLRNDVEITLFEKNYLPSS